MDEQNNIRNRKEATQKPNKQNRITQENGKKEKYHITEFAERESPLTLLLQSSLHIRAIYHIFIAILILLLLDTLIFDLIENGKINLGISAVIYGFGDVVRCAKFWMFELSLALIYYPGLRLYAVGSKKLRKHHFISQIWSYLCLVGLILLQTVLIMVPVWCLGKEHLAIASGSVVTLEMIRFFMKIHAVSIACVPRCHKDGEQLPSFLHYLYFLFAPTLLYRDKYPRTKKTRWGAVIYHFMEVLAIIFYNSFLWERFILPYWSDFGKETKVEAGRVVRGMFACILPGVISFLCGFYCVLHAWLNAFSEILTFADRLFYEDWWTKSQFSSFYRSWNRVVYSWLRDYIYLPMVPHVGKSAATFTVFFTSAAAHELVLALSFGFLYPVLLVLFGVLGLLLVPLTASTGRRFPNIMNLIMWLGFLFGNGILWSLYPMEHFARKNCPPSENDSFFIPKSWSCPEIILSPNWTFHNSTIY